MRVTNGIPLGCSLLLPVVTVNSVQTLKAVDLAALYKPTDRKLQAAYVRAIRLAKAAGVKTIAFSLISAGIFAGGRGMKTVLRLSMKAIKAVSYPGLQVGCVGLHHGFRVKAAFYPGVQLGCVSLHHGFRVKAVSYPGVQLGCAGLHHGFRVKAASYPGVQLGCAGLHHGFRFKAASYPGVQLGCVGVHHGFRVKAASYPGLQVGCVGLHMDSVSKQHSTQECS
jgi:hypothetical protein